MDTNTPKPLAFSYRRFSSVKQEENDSLRRQKDIAEECAREHNLRLVDDEEYTFLDRAKSAFSGANINDDDSQLRRFYELVKQGSIPMGSYLIVESLDRLSRRHPKEALPRFLDLLNAGINVITGTDKRVYTNDVQELDLIVSIMEMSRSYRESKVKSDRVGARWREKQREAREELKPMGATKPAWLDAIYREEDRDNPKKKPTHYVVNEGKAKIVRQIFQMTLDGYGRNVIAQKLNEQGHLSFKGKTWGGSSVAQILKSPTVLGIYQPFKSKGKDRVPVGEPIRGLYEPIVDETTFYAAQKATTDRFRERTTKQSSNFNVWQGLLKCTKCHAALNLYSKGPGQRKYLRCYEAGKGKCDAKAIRLDQGEEVFKQLLTKVNSLSLVQSDARSLEIQLNETVGRINEQRSLMSEHLEFLRTRRSLQIQGLVADCEDEIALLEQKKSELEQALAVDRVTNKEEFFARLDLESYEGRARANELLKRLKVVVTAFKEGDVATYLVRKNEEPILTMVQVHDIITVPLNAEQRDKFKEQDADGSDYAKGMAWLQKKIGPKPVPV